MTEAEWLACDDPRPMLEYLADQMSDRKATLYACGGLRHIWDLWLYSDRSRKAVEVAVLWADGQATEDEVGHAAYRAEVPTFGFNFSEQFKRPRQVMHGSHRLQRIKGLDADEYEAPEDELTCDPEEERQLLNAAHIAYHVLSISDRVLDDHLLDHISRQADWPGVWLVRDIFGNPFRPVAFDPRWRTETAVALASGIYADRAFDRMPVLADALEEAGCDHADILSHCRGPGPHARGCWVIDGVLGKA